MIAELLQSNSKFFKPDPVFVERQQAWDRVFKQAIGHTRRLEEDEILAQVRPSETKIINEYRNKNKRLLTKEGIDKAGMKFGRIMDHSGVDVDESTLSPKLNDWLDSEPFIYLGQYSGLWEFAYRVMFQSCIEDPNAVLVAFPYNPQNRETPPDYPFSQGGLDAGKTISIEVQIIESSKLRYISNDVFSYSGGRIIVNERTEKTAEWFWVVDSFEWGRMLPYLNDKNQVEYRYERWYIHDSEFLPLNFLPGRLCKTENGTLYYESFMHTYFEYADEFKASFSDNQSVRVLHNHPKAIMSELPCPIKECKGGNIQKVIDGKTVYDKCTTCGGSGILKDPGPYAVLTRRAGTGSEGEDKSKVYEYVTPPTELIKISYDIAFDLLERGKRSGGLDLLLDIQESGVAKGKRLEDLQDMLIEISGIFFDTIEMLLESVDCLLNVNKNERSIPKVIRPKSFHLKDEINLKEDYEKSLSFDRYESAIQLLRHKYRGDNKKIEAYEIMFKTYPILLLNDSELEQRFRLGIYTNEDILKKDSMISIMTDILDTEFRDAEFIQPERFKAAIAEKLDQINFNIVPLMN